MGRPSKATEQRVEALLGALRAGNTREAAAAHAGTDRTTLYRWLGRNRALRSRVEQAEADAEVRYAAQVAQAGSTDWRAAAWWLERRRPARYGRAQAYAAASAVTAEPTLAPHPLDELPAAEQVERAQAWAERFAAQAAQDAAAQGSPQA